MNFIFGSLIIKEPATAYYLFYLICLCQAVFNKDEAKLALTGGKAYRAACNMFWLDIVATSSPGVPMDEERVRKWARTVLSGNGAAHLREMVVVGVAAADTDLEASKGSWKQVTPEELTHSIIFYLEELVLDDKTTDATLNEWKAVLLSTPVMFVVLDGDDAHYWEAYEQRQRTGIIKFMFCFLKLVRVLHLIMIQRPPGRIVQTHDTIRRTARQWAHELTLFKERKEAELGETLTIKKLAAIYKDRMGKTAESTKSEMGHSDQFINDCLKVYEKLLTDKYINGKLDSLEKKFGLDSCLNNLAKLRIIVEKTGNLKERQWVIAWIEDALTAGGTPPLLTNDAVAA